MTCAERTLSRPEPVEVALARVARRQFGTVSRQQAHGVGMTDAAIHRRVAQTRWERIFPGVYLIAAVPPSWEQHIFAACLAGGDGSAASHRAGGRVWNLAAFGRAPLEISVPRGRTRTLDRVIVHRPRDLPSADRTRQAGIPVTTPTRTLIDLASVAPIDAVEEALDDALRRHLTSLPLLRNRLTALGRNGRRGVAAFRALLDARASGTPVAESPFETRLFRELKRSGLPLPIPQYRIVDRGRFVARVDFAYPDVKLAIEADGYRYHSGRARFESDRARLNALTAAGWRVIHVTWAQLRDEPDTVVTTIGRALGHR